VQATPRQTGVLRCQIAADARWSAAVALALITPAENSRGALLPLPAQSPPGDGFLELRCRRPPSRAEVIPRERITHRLAAARETQVVLLRAPAGYGKTTVLQEWTGVDPRPCVWATLRSEDNDPAMLIAVVALAFEPVDPIGWEVSEALSSGRPDAHEVALVRLARALSLKEAPFVLVLDDLHELHTRGARTVVACIRKALPAGSQLVIGSRTDPRLPMARLRAAGASIEFGVRELAMTNSEAEALLRTTGLEAGSEDAAALVERAEGWPAALFLAGLSRQDQDDGRFVTEYVREELLAELSQERLEFLTRSSVLELLTAEQCDAVLERQDSAGQLEALSRANVPLEPLGHGSGAYRYNPVFAEVLRAELRRLEPEREPALHRRASAWLERNGADDAAVNHALQAGDLPRSARLLWAVTPEAVGQGRGEAVTARLEQLGERTLAELPMLGLTAAGGALLSGDLYETERWTTIAAAGSSSSSSRRRSGREDAALALMRAGIGRHGLRHMAADAARAHTLLEEHSTWRPLCRFFEGVALHLDGEMEGARHRLADGAYRAALSSPLIQALCLAQLALLEDDDGDPARASSLASRARAQVGRFGLERNPLTALVLAVSCVHRRERPAADTADDLQLARRLLTRLPDPSPWFDAECRISLSRAVLRSSGPAAAHEVLAPALAFAQEAPVLTRRVDDGRRQIECASGTLATSDWCLTAAELRVLSYLPSHLSFREIAGRLYVSQNTVKTHARAIYRKLGVSSRGSAVDLARGGGLVDSAAGA
jgi:LuxR family transcriptional regulator, maltose regulon positive regulatory protein